ncbi:hypothetical protein LMTR3_16635 [Bradyrhizobium sp. LMTR 3]|nr:hypothetical protein LMTR3_16635 [Bradyrhizobium sp. LMTR 3]
MPSGQARVRLVWFTRSANELIGLDQRLAAFGLRLRLPLFSWNEQGVHLDHDCLLKIPLLALPGRRTFLAQPVPI